MKLQAELNETIKKFKAIADRIPEHVENVKKSGDYNVLKTRIAWDCIRTVYTPMEICEWYEKYNCNDKHITTLAVKALETVYKI